jgi:hypothetical protein
VEPAIQANALFCSDGPSKNYMTAPIELSCLACKYLKIMGQNRQP